MSDLIQYLHERDKEVEYLRSVKDFRGAEKLLREICGRLRAERGDDDLTYALRLERLAELLVVLEEYDEAKRLLENTLAVRRSRLGEHHTACATTLHRLAGVLFRLDDFVGAESHLKTAIQLRSAALGAHHSRVAQMSNDLSVIIRAREQSELVPEALNAYNEARQDADTGDFAGAERHFLTAISLNEAKLGLCHPHTASCKSALADLYLQMEQPRRALTLITEAVWIRSFFRDQDRIAYALEVLHLGRVHGSLGNRTNAERQLIKAISLLEAAGDPGREGLANALNSLASLELEIGRFRQSALTLEKAAKIYESLDKADTSEYASMRANLAYSYTRSGRHAEAERSYILALDIKRRLYSETHHSYLRTLGNYAIFLAGVGRKRQAASLLSETLAGAQVAFGENNPKEIHLLDALAGIAEEQGQYRAASKLFGRAAEISQQTRGANHPLTLFQQMRTAGFFTGRGLLEEAKSILDHIESKLANRELNELAVKCYRLQGQLALANEDPAGAITYFERALSMPESGSIESDSEDRWACFHQYMFGLLRTGHFDLALLRFDDFAKAVAAAFHNIVGLLGESDSLATLPNMLLQCSLTLLWHKGHEIDSLAYTSFEHILRYRGCVLDVLALRHQFATAQEDDSSILAEITNARTRLHNMVLNGPIPGLEEEYLSEVAATREEVWRREQQLTAKLAEISRDTLLPKVRGEDLASVLEPDSVLIEFIRFAPLSNESEEQYLAFVYEHPNTVRSVWLGPAQELEKWLCTWREEIAVVPEARLPADVLKVCEERLCHLLVAPLFREFASRKVWVVPDGELWHVPFDALPTSEGKYLGDLCSISYLAASRDLIRLRKGETVKSAAAVVFADPNYDLEDARDAESRRNAQMQDEFEQYERGASKIPTAYITNSSPDTFWTESGLERCNRLPGTRAEAEQVANILAVDPIVGDDALDTSLKRIRSPRILHLATHGFFWNSPDHWKYLLFKRDLYGTERSLGASLAKSAVYLSEASRILRASLDKFDISDTNVEINTCLSEVGEAITEPVEAHFDDPLLCSGLLLAGVNTWVAKGAWAERAEDGIFTAQDVLGLDLTGTEIVALSACETGLGSIRNSEGVFGLRRAFAIAGARTLVMSLWRVSDDVTRLLMTRFYNELMAGRCRDEALRLAKLHVRSMYRDPFYWAPFICQGDQDALISAL